MDVQLLSTAVSFDRPGDGSAFGFAVSWSVLVTGSGVGLALGEELAEGEGAGLAALQFPLPVAPPLHVALHVPDALPSFEAPMLICPVLSYRHDRPLTMASPTTIVISEPEIEPLPDPGFVTVTSLPETENSTSPEALPE